MDRAVEIGPGQQLSQDLRVDLHVGDAAGVVLADTSDAFHL